MCQELLLLRGNFVGTISFPLLVQELAGSKSECDKGSSGSLAWSFNIKNPHIPLVSTIANYRIFFLISFCMPFVFMQMLNAAFIIVVMENVNIAKIKIFVNTMHRERVN